MPTQGHFLCLKTFVILWILSVYCSTTLRRYGNYVAALLDTTSACAASGITKYNRIIFFGLALYQLSYSISTDRTRTCDLLRDIKIAELILKLGTSGGTRTHINQLSVATGYKSAVLPLNYRGIKKLVRLAGIEPTFTV